MTLDEQRKEQSPYDAAGPHPSRHLASFAASIAAHAAIAGLIVCFASPVAKVPGEFVLAYLVQGTGGDAGRGGAHDGAAPPASIHAHGGGGPLTTPESVSVDQRKRKRKQELADAPTRPAPVRSAAAAPPPDSEHDGHWRIRDNSSGGASGSRTAAVTANGAGTGGGVAAGGIDGDGGRGAGGGGDPNSIAHADYARNPLPAYPASARRRAQQGTVTVRVLVGADGTVARAEVAESSGFDALDDAALETVRSRWRFAPARRGGHPVESWVLVPIRFALIEASAAR